MMSGFVRYLELQARYKTGLSGPVAGFAIAAAICGAVTFGLVVFAAFIWLADRYSPLTAALVLAAFFLLLTIVALIVCQIMHSRTVEEARVELAARAQQPWLDPRYFGVALEVGRSIGMRRLLPLVGVGLVAAGLAKEWGSRSNGKGDDTAEDGAET
jgi:hypothetical protein